MVYLEMGDPTSQSAVGSSQVPGNIIPSPSSSKNQFGSSSHQSQWFQRFLPPSVATSSSAVQKESLHVPLPEVYVTQKRQHQDDSSENSGAVLPSNEDIPAGTDEEKVKQHEIKISEPLSIGIAMETIDSKERREITEVDVKRAEQPSHARNVGSVSKTQIVNSDSCSAFSAALVSVRKPPLPPGAFSRHKRCLSSINIQARFADKESRAAKRVKILELANHKNNSAVKSMEDHRKCKGDYQGYGVAGTAYAGTGHSEMLVLEQTTFACSTTLACEAVSASDCIQKGNTSDLKTGLSLREDHAKNTVLKNQGTIPRLREEETPFRNRTFNIISKITQGVRGAINDQNPSLNDFPSKTNKSSILQFHTFQNKRPPENGDVLTVNKSFQFNPADLIQGSSTYNLPLQEQSSLKSALRHSSLGSLASVSNSSLLVQTAYSAPAESPLNNLHSPETSSTLQSLLVSSHRQSKERFNKSIEGSASGSERSCKGLSGKTSVENLQKQPDINNLGGKLLCKSQGKVHAAETQAESIEPNMLKRSSWRNKNNIACISRCQFEDVDNQEMGIHINEKNNICFNGRKKQPYSEIPNNEVERKSLAFRDQLHGSTSNVHCSGMKAKDGLEDTGNYSNLEVTVTNRSGCDKVPGCHAKKLSRLQSFSSHPSNDWCKSALIHAKYSCQPSNHLSCSVAQHSAIKTLEHHHARESTVQKGTGNSIKRKFDLASVLSLPWIQRWCQSCSQNFLANVGSHLDDFPFRSLPSAAAIALVGIAAQKPRTCKLQKKGSLSVWNSVDFTVNSTAE